MRSSRRALILGLTSLLLVAAGTQSSRPASASDSAKVINLYSARLTAADNQLYQLFTEKTGIKINTVQGKPKELLQRIMMTGNNSDADIFISQDGADLVRAANYKLLQPAASDTLTGTVPAAMRDAEGRWIGFSWRARLIVFDTSKVKASKLSTYEELADPRWQGEILTRSSTADDTQALVATIIDAAGLDQATAWTRGMAQNFARHPQGSDGDQVKAMANGDGTVALCSSDKFARVLLTKDPMVKQALKHIGVFFPNQQDRGVHVDLAGVGIVVNAPHRDNAIKFLEFMVSPDAQRLLADINFVYPVRADVPPTAAVAAWGKFKADDPRSSAIVNNNGTAIDILNHAGWQ